MQNEIELLYQRLKKFEENMNRSLDEIEKNVKESLPQIRSTRPVGMWAVNGKIELYIKEGERE